MVLVLNIMVGEGLNEAMLLIKQAKLNFACPT